MASPSFSLFKLENLSLSAISRSINAVGFPCGSVVKNLPAMQEMWVQSLGWEDSLEEGMATHCSILARRISWTEDLGGI